MIRTILRIVIAVPLVSKVPLSSFLENAGAVAIPAAIRD